MLSFCDVQLLTPAIFTFSVILIPPLSHHDASLKLQQVALVFIFSIAVVVIQAGPTRGQYYCNCVKEPASFLFSTFFFFSTDFCSEGRIPSSAARTDGEETHL